MTASLAAAPGCYLTTFRKLIDTKGPQDGEQNIFGQIAFGMDEADYCIMRAPKPTLICAGTRDVTFDFGGHDGAVSRCEALLLAPRLLRAHRHRRAGCAARLHDATARGGGALHEPLAARQGRGDSRSGNCPTR
jgi:hypothetical protein